MFRPAWPIATDRLVLRPFAADDLDVMVVIHSAPSTARYLYHGVRDRESVEALLDTKIHGAQIAAVDEWVSAAVISRDSGALVADVSLCWRSDEHRQAEIGFITHPAHRGHGYAAEAARPLIDFAFATLECHRVFGRLDARNTASARVLEKLGMRHEAHLVDNEMVKGEWTSESVYAVLARDWDPRHA